MGFTEYGRNPKGFRNRPRWAEEFNFHAAGTEAIAACRPAAVELLRPENGAFRKLAGLDENSVILVINTEGATDRENYRNIVWNGAWPAPVSKP